MRVVNGRLIATYLPNSKSHDKDSHTVHDPTCLPWPPFRGHHDHRIPPSAYCDPSSQRIPPCWPRPSLDSLVRITIFGRTYVRAKTRLSLSPILPGVQPPWVVCTRVIHFSFPSNTHCLRYTASRCRLPVALPDGCYQRNNNLSNGIRAFAQD
jgi:hypothetical protein